MKVQKIISNSNCNSCSKGTLIYKLDRPIDLVFMGLLISEFNMIEEKQFTKAGILYLHNMTFICHAPIGSDRITIKCKIADCSEKEQKLQNFLESMG